jgi:hypothetical protein
VIFQDFGWWSQIGFPVVFHPHMRLEKLEPDALSIPSFDGSLAGVLMVFSLLVPLP